MTLKTPVIPPTGIRDSCAAVVPRITDAAFTGAALIGVAGIADGQGSSTGPLTCACAAGLVTFAEILFRKHVARAEERRIR